jgi:MscS family membrane protein
MNLLRLCLLFCFVFGNLFAQPSNEDERPKDDYATPYNALHSFIYYMSAEHYQSQKLNRIFPKGTENPSEVGLQLKQVLDGRGFRIKLNNIPGDSSYTDSVSKKQTYVLFDEIPEIYIERDKETQKWRFSRETIQAIPRLHKRIYPLGSDILLRLIPSFGEDKILGLAVWQYAGIFVVGVLAWLLAWAVSRLLRWGIQKVAESKLGKGHFDTNIVLKIARLLSYLMSFYLLYLFIPALQLPIGLGVYVIGTLRLLTTLFIVLFLVRCIDLARSYIQMHLPDEENPEQPENRSVILNEQLMPILARTLKVVVWVGGFFHGLSILDVDITALVAGLSIGGLALALAAQETVKNLIGSVMIFADKPFKIGDYIKNDSDIEGTVEDIGFRSTRIRTLDTSIIAVPNGKLIDMIVNNLGARQKRRFRINIEINFDTEPELLEVFIEGLRKMVSLHPVTDKEEIYIYLNNVQNSAMGILFMIYFNTNDWKEELESREQILLSILRLAKSVGIRIALPAQSIHIENIPKNPREAPNIQNLVQNKAAHLDAFLQDFQTRYPLPPPNIEPDEEEQVPSPS